MRDQYGNYVVQRCLEVATAGQRGQLLEIIRVRGRQRQGREVARGRREVARRGGRETRMAAAQCGGRGKGPEAQALACCNSASQAVWRQRQAVLAGSPMAACHILHQMALSASTLSSVPSALYLPHLLPTALHLIHPSPAPAAPS